MVLFKEINEAVCEKSDQEGYKHIVAAVRATLPELESRSIDCIIRDGKAIEPERLLQEIRRIGEEQGLDTMVYVVSEGTGSVYQTRPRGCLDGLQLQGIGGGEIYTGLERLRGSVVGHNNHDNQEAYAIALATTNNPPPLLIETGAGMDLSRIQKLHDIQTAGGEKFIAHDTSPLVAEKVRKKAHNIIYFGLPQEYLNAVVEAEEGEVTVSMKDTLSSMAFGQIDNLLLMLERHPHILRVVMTQSLGEAGLSNKYPIGYQTNDPALDEKIMGMIRMNALEVGQTLTSPESMLYLVQQMKHSLMIIMMDVARNYVFSGARKIGFKRCDTEITETTEQLEPVPAQLYLSTNYPELLSDFEQGVINEIVIGPFGIHWRKDKKVPEGKLKITNQNYHLILERRGRYQSTNRPSNINSLIIQEKEILAPTNQLGVSPYILIGNRETGRKVSEHMIKNISPQESQNVQRLGMSLAFRMIYGVFRELFSLGHINQEVIQAFLHQNLLRASGLKTRR